MLLEIDPLLNYSINKFFLLFIPKIFLDNLPALLTASMVTLIPYTPINALIFALIFMIIYFTDIFGLASKEINYCRFNKPENRTEISIWSTLKNTYYWYFLVMLIVNYNTIAQYRFFNTNATQ